MEGSYQDIQGSRKHLDTLTVQGQHFSINHYIYGRFQGEFDSPHASMGGEWVPNVGAVKKCGQVPQKSDSPNRAPTNVFDQAIARRCLRRDHHLTARIAAIIEAKKKAAPPVEFAVVVSAEGERPAAEAREAQQHGQQISEFPEALEEAIGRGGYIGCEAHAEQIDKVKLAAGMLQAKHVARFSRTGEDGFSGMFRPIAGEVSKKRVPGAKRQKT